MQFVEHKFNKIYGWVEDQKADSLFVGPADRWYPRDELVLITEAEYLAKSELMHMFESVTAERFERISLVGSAMKELGVQYDYEEVCRSVFDPWLDLGCSG